MNLITAFDIKKGDLVAIVGGGGKSSLLFALEQAWEGPIVLTTTTRIFQAQIARARASLSLDALDQLGAQLKHWGSCLIIGRTHNEKAHGVPIEYPARWLTRPDVDIVAVEADGSRMLPVKAPAEHEPAMPTGTTLGVIVVGIDAFDRPISEVAHRPKLVCAITNQHPPAYLTPTTLATLLTHPHGGLKNMPPTARVAVCINKVETPHQRQLATQTAHKLIATGKIERVVVTALQAASPQTTLFLSDQTNRLYFEN